MNTTTETRSSTRAFRLLACLGAAGIAAIFMCGLTGCAAAKSGPEYHSDIDHNGQPFDGEFRQSNSVSDGKSAEVECEHHKKDR